MGTSAKVESCSAFFREKLTNNGAPPSIPSRPIHFDVLVYEYSSFVLYSTSRSYGTYLEHILQHDVQLTTARLCWLPIVQGSQVQVLGHKGLFVPSGGEGGHRSQLPTVLSCTSLDSSLLWTTD